MEDKKDKLDRLKMMVNDKYGKWDLSDNDIEAIKYGIECIEAQTAEGGQADLLVTKSEQKNLNSKPGDVWDEEKGWHNPNSANGAVADIKELEFMIDNLPENRPLYKDSGLWQIRNEEMVMCWYEQDVNESFSEFIKRAFDCENQLQDYGK